MGSIIKNNFFTLLVSLAVIVLSTIPIPETPMDGVPFIDKWVHFVMYGGVSVAMWFDLYFVRKERSLSAKFNVAVLTYPVILGGLMELVQEYLTTYRNGDFLDFWADWFGAILGNVISVLIFLYLTKVTKN